MSAVVWVHEDALNHLLLHHGPALFVFDDEYLRGERYSLKRIAFIYECLLELPVEIMRGETVRRLLDFARRHGGDEIVCASSPNPWIRARIAELQRSLPVRIVEPEPFVRLSGEPDLKRFSRYWAKVESRLPICQK